MSRLRPDIKSDFIGESFAVMAAADLLSAMRAVGVYPCDAVYDHHNLDPVRHHSATFDLSSVYA